VDSTSGCDLLCFLDAYSGFHQIPLYRNDEEHIAFIIVDDLFCYVSMSYGLKNALPTFVRAMHKTFDDLIGDLIEVYVDDIVVKIKSRASLLDNIAHVFDRLWSTRTKLNSNKCVFEVTAGKLLDFLVSYQGIKANPEKIMTIEAMRPPTRIKDVQKLTGCLAALRHFISRLAEWALPFFRLLHKSASFVWIDKAEEAFQELKRYLTSLSVMVAPEPREPLPLYITTIAEAVSMVLVAKWSKPPQPQETKETSTNGSGSHDPEPAVSPNVRVTVGSQLPEASLAPEHQAGPNKVTRSQPLEANSGPVDLKATAPRPLETFSDLGSHGPSGPEPMEVDEPTPL
jgi:dsDNA-binding SOS-regulon protein